MPAVTLSRSPASIGAPAVPHWLCRAFAVDVRALSVLRIGIGLLLLVDLAGRVPDLTAHYTDAGVLPRSARMAMSWDFSEPWWVSLHMLSGSWWWQAFLFGCAFVAAAMLTVGYRTKPALFASCVLLLSLHGRFPLLTQGGDALLRCMMVWALFLPLDACWSLGDKRSAAERRGYVANIATIALVGQLAIMYIFSAMLKTSPTWRGDFSAAYYALSIDHFTSEWGYSLLAYPRLLQWLTMTSLLLERVGPLVLLVPFWHSLARIVVPLAFLGFHIGLALTLDLGTFPWICGLMWLVLLPPIVWDYVERVANTVSQWFGGAASHSYRRAGGTVTYIGTAASNLIAGFLLTYVVLLNINRMEHPLATVGEAPLSLVGKAVGLDQYWNMFAPGPYQFGGWIRIEGETADGQLVNLYRPDEPLPNVKPVNVSGTYDSQYWRRCLVTMYEFQETPHLEGGLRYFARQWNEHHDPSQRIVKAKFVHMVEPTPPPFAARGPSDIQRQELSVVEF